MDSGKTLAALAAAGTYISGNPDDLQAILHRTEVNNPWFTQAESMRMLESICSKLLNGDLLTAWAKQYLAAPQAKTIGLVLAGNVPFVGMHDLICVLASGHNALVKLSSKDVFFFPWFKQVLTKIDAGFNSRITFVDKLENFDAVIATGSNNSARYFEYYFGKYPHIIRKNRTSVAILKGDETQEQLYQLGKDIFYYYGLGCRNVGKIFFPEQFDRQLLFKYWEDYRYVTDNTKYKNNYDYNRALLLLNNTNYLTNDFYMLVESGELFSPLSVVYCETYPDEKTLQEKLEAIAPDLQCIVAAGPGNTAFGQTQYPGLSDYADHVDTMAFLSGLSY